MCGPTLNALGKVLLISGSFSSGVHPATLERGSRAQFESVAPLDRQSRQGRLQALRWLDISRLKQRRLGKRLWGREKSVWQYGELVNVVAKLSCCVV